MSAADTVSTVKARSNDQGRVMGFSRKRTSRDGRSRYTAYYLDIRGQERSAGTFSNRKDANDAWKKAEAGVRDKWLPHHLLEPRRQRQLQGPDPQAPDAVLWADEDARHHARTCPRV